MSYNKYYQDELAFLRELGKEFSDANPGLTHYLSDRSNDPDVERLLEGFAFLSGRLRQKLDDELPELTHTMMALLWPHFLRPVPSMSILQFDPVPYAITEKKQVSRGVEVESRPVAGTGISCRFRTCYDVELLPLTMDQVELKRLGDGSVMELGLEVSPGVSLEDLGLQRLRFYLHGGQEQHISQSLYLWLFRYLEKIHVSVSMGDGEHQSYSLNPESLIPAGFGEEEGLLPYPPNAFIGYRLLQEYFSLPEKFLFVELTGLESLSRYALAERIDLRFEFSRPLDEQVRLRKEHVRLYCTPIVNLFKRSGEPLRVNHRQTEYRVRMQGGDPAHHEIFSIDRVEGWVQGNARKKVYRSFESFEHETDELGEGLKTYYRARLKSAVAGRGVDTYLSFVDSRCESSFPPTETIALELTCSNRNLPEKLHVGDISVATGNSPEFATFRNIVQVSPSMPPPLEAGLHWQLISNMALNYLSLARVDTLRALLSTYDFKTFFDIQAERTSRKRLEGIDAIAVQPIDRIYRGLPIRGLRTTMELRESRFGGEGPAGEGGMYLFASVLNEFFSLFASINSFHQLKVKGIERGEEYQWPTRIGQQPLL
ncbi:MAG: type VI secretion system baseplate subunit TssF [Gammaproteobacteria bacterium]|nr:type VI secretion system baseplate subunit TssF [Gammaproteobacteria bacterium]